MEKILSYFKNPYKFIPALGRRGYLSFLSDKTYLKLMYRARMDKKLNLENPTTYNEKLQWLKLYDRNPLYPSLVDKYRVRDYVIDSIGVEHLIPLLGVWDDVDDIRLDQLPEQFVLKTNNDSGGVFICKDKSDFDFEETKRMLQASLNNNYSKANREWVYDGIEPKVIAEKYMVQKSGEGLDDYKFFCFNGKVRAGFVATDRSTDVKFDFFDENFNCIPLKQTYPNSDKIHVKPKNYDKMIEISEALSNGLAHVRIDLYNDNGDIYFGEITFYHFSGTHKFDPEKYDKVFGDWITLPK